MATGRNVCGCSLPCLGVVSTGQTQLTTGTGYRAPNVCSAKDTWTATSKAEFIPGGGGRSRRAS